MGLIKAAFGSAGGVLADQWKEFFYCDALDKNTLVVRGQKKTTRRSSNTKGNDNVISNGSGIAVADGQCMIIVDQGKVAEVCAEPGEFTWDSSSEPSVFTGKFGDSLKKTFTAIGKRFSYGGDPGKDQRVYYFNTKEILDNKFGTATPIDFRVVDSRVGIDRDVRLRVNGTYSYRISDPILFYTNVCGNVAGSYERSELDGQLKTEFVSALMPAVGRMSELELRPNQLMNHTKELRDYLNQELTAEWAEKARTVGRVGRIGRCHAVRRGRRTAPAGSAGSHIPRSRYGCRYARHRAGRSHARTAAGNTGGAMTGFMGMGMAMNAGANTQNLYAMQQQQQQQQAAQPQPAPAQARRRQLDLPRLREDRHREILSRVRCQKPEAKPADSWVCPNAERPRQANSAPNAARHARRTMAGSAPAARITRGDSARVRRQEAGGCPRYRCDKCGWVPEDPTNPPKFCPECGNRFDENDIVR